MDMDRIELSGFTTKESGVSGRMAGRRGYDRPRSSRRSCSRHGGRGVTASSMLVKLGICALAAAAVLIVRLRTDAPAAGVITAKAQVNASETDFDEMLGKLRFVELPGIIEVFASADKIALPVEYSSYSVEPDSHIMTLRISADGDFAAPCAGEVKSIDKDAVLGEYVAVMSVDDTELRFFGLSDISVEDGQPLSAGDSIGRVYAGDSLHVSVNAGGRPLPPSEIFQLQDEN